MAGTNSFGPSGSFNNSWTGATTIYQYIGYPTGNINLAGTRIVSIDSISVNGLSGGYAGLDANGNITITRTGTYIYFSRYYQNTNATIYETGPGSSPWYNSSLGGSYNWTTVPSAPVSLSYNTPAFTQSTLTLNYLFSGSLDNGGQGISSYTAEYRNTAAGIGIKAASRTGTTATITTVSAHGYTAGGIIQVYDLVSSNAPLNGQWTISSVTSDTITFTTSTSGTINPTNVSLGLVGLYGNWGNGKSVTSPFSFSNLIPARYYQARIYANNSRGASQPTTITPYFVLPEPPVWGTKTLNPSIVQNKPYSDFLNITGYTLSTNVVVKAGSGSLPPGLSLTTTQVDNNNATVTISGTPTTVGNYTFILEATNVGGTTASSSYTLGVASSSTVWNSPGKGSLTNTDNTSFALRNSVAYNPSGISGIVASGDYLYAVGAITNGYAISSGSLPSGLTATNTTGTINGQTVNIYRIYGTPTVSGNFSFTVSVSVGGDPIYQTVSINIRPTGKRFTAVSPINQKSQITTWKRNDAASGWKDVAIAKRYDEDGTSPGVAGWVDLINPYLINPS